MNGNKTACDILTEKVPIAYTHQSIRHVEKMLLDQEANYETIDYIYILNKEEKLKGILSIKDLFRLPKGSLIDDVMTKKVVTVHPHTHREKIVAIALANNIKAIPVVDKEKKFLGVVSNDVILSATHEELTEDLLKFEGITGQDKHSLSVLRSSPSRLLKARLPWLIFGLLGGIFAAAVVGHFETLLAEEAALIGFIPLMVYMSDAVGSQSQTIYIRAIAMEKTFSNVTYFMKELTSGFLISVVLSILLGVAISFLHAPHLGIILGTSLFFTILASVIIAIVTPAALIKLGKDPAVGSGPFATIIRDIMSILIYFSIANIMLSSVSF